MPPATMPPATTIYLYLFCSFCFVLFVFMLLSLSLSLQSSIQLLAEPHRRLHVPGLRGLRASTRAPSSRALALPREQRERGPAHFQARTPLQRGGDGRPSPPAPSRAPALTRGRLTVTHSHMFAAPSRAKRRCRRVFAATSPPGSLFCGPVGE